MAKKIKIYSTPTCPFCRMAKSFFKEKNMEFEDINVADDEKAAKEIMEKTGQMSVPVIDIDGKLIVGFDKEKIEEFL